MADHPSPPTHRLSTTVVMSIAAVAAALIAIFGDKTSIGWLTIVCALVGLVPWAIESGGVHLSPAVFATATLVPAAGIVLVDRNPGGMFPVMLAVVWVVRSTSDRRIEIATVVAAVSLTVGIAIREGTAHETGMVYFMGGVGVAWLAGSMLRRQEQLVDELRTAHDQQAAHAAAAERTRIAREVHDVVAHSLTVTMLHVTGARRVLATDPERAADALERAESVGRESLDSIRRVVGLLRDESAGAGQHQPLPTLDEAHALVDEYRAAGLQVDARIDIDGLCPDAGVALAAYRVVQEAMSNVLQHAPGAPLRLRVGPDGHGTVLRIVAENPLTSAPGRTERVGLGVRGMSERVRAAGGTLEAGVHDGTWRVEAALPVRSMPSVGLAAPLVEETA